MEKPLALVCSVELEMAPLRSRVEQVATIPSRTTQIRSGRLKGRDVLLVTGGMGKANGAHALTVALERHDVGGVIGFGVGGAYVGSGLGVGDVAIATAEHYADEGVAAPGGWLDPRAMGIPLVARQGREHYATFPVDEAALPELRRALPRSVAGPFATVSACSGTAERGAELAGRYGAICESMEGAAYAHVCVLYGVPFLEIRGISNLVEDRDLAGWRLIDAAEAAAAAVAAVVEVWHPISPTLEPPRES